MRYGYSIITEERRRQIDKEGFDAPRDDEYVENELMHAGLSYYFHAKGISESNEGVPSIWPWDKTWWKPSGTLRCLAKAGALFLAEKERLQRTKWYADTTAVDEYIGAVLDELAALK